MTDGATMFKDDKGTNNTFLKLSLYLIIDGSDMTHKKPIECTEYYWFRFNY